MLVACENNMAYRSFLVNHYKVLKGEKIHLRNRNMEYVSLGESTGEPTEEKRLHKCATVEEIYEYIES